MNDIIITINRFHSTVEGTVGKLKCPHLYFDCRTIELPWKDNQKNISCIPEGTYEAEHYLSESRGDTYKLKDVPGRTSILIHVGNWAGDISQGLKSDSEGCILLGQDVDRLSSQLAVTQSRKTMKHFIEMTEKKPIIINIRDLTKCGKINTPWGGR